MGTLNFGARAPHMQQFDLKGKETRDLTPEELEANLRSHGCPANMVARVVERHSKRYGYSRKQSVVGGGSEIAPKVKIEERVARMLDLLHKAALGRNLLSHSLAQSLLDAQRDTSPTYQSDDHTCTNPSSCYHCMRSHLRTAYDLAECSYSITQQVNDMLDDWPDTKNGDMEEDDSLRSKTPKAKAKLHNAFRRMHREVHKMLADACFRMYEAGLTVDQIVD